jgi:hypothetical protein
MKQTRAASIRRRRLATSLSVALVLSGVAVLATQLPAHSHDHHDADDRPAATATATVDTAPERTLKHAIRDYLKHRDGAVSAAVYDNVAKRLVVVHPAVRGRTASIVKVDILETLLHRTRGHLSAQQRETARNMIEHSDNDSATDLWNQDGGASGVKAYNDDVGLKQTTPNVDWGLTITSASDQVTLVRQVLHKTPLLTNRSRAFQRRLMKHVESDQQWGISGGLPHGVKFGIKNGWLPVDEDHDRWAVNSEGWVRGDGKRYEIAVVTQHDSTESYGIHTIEHIAAMVWRRMAVDKS